MRVCSLVVCTSIAGECTCGCMVMPEIDKVYTVRGLPNKGDILAKGVIARIDAVWDCIYLEEIINKEVKRPYDIGFLESPYRRENFKEVCPPIENIEDEINTNIITIQEPETVS